MPSSAASSAEICGGPKGEIGTLGIGHTPQESSTLKNVIPTLALGGSAANALLSAPVMTLHFVGWVGSFATGVASHSCDVCSGGRLQFMLPLRSTMKSTFAGTMSDFTLA